MASSSLNYSHNCIRCPKQKLNNGRGVFSCNGCRQAFCLQHTIDHRRELGNKLDSIAYEHDVIHQRIIDENGSDELREHLQSIAQQLKSNRQTDDFLESDLVQWHLKLNEIKSKLELVRVRLQTLKNGSAARTYRPKRLATGQRRKFPRSPATVCHQRPKWQI